VLACVNLASRLCAEAKAGEILASERVFSMVGGRAAAQPVGGLALKGFSRPVTAYRLSRHATS
jgi:class 3 adenylate cyclase